MPRLTASLALAGMCLLAAGASLHARIIEVPDHQRTIQNAYDVSRPGDTILVHPGEYTCAITIDHDLTLAGEYLLTGDTSTVEETILRNEGSPIIQIGGVLVNFYLRGLSLRNARAGLIPAQNGQGAGTIEISQCCFDTLSQRAVFLQAQFMLVERTTFRFCNCNQQPVYPIVQFQIRDQFNIPVLRQSSYLNCYSPLMVLDMGGWGGIVDECYFEGNTGANTGVIGPTTASISNSVFVRNQGTCIAESYGIISNCRFEENQAQNGILYYPRGRVTKCVFIGNIATRGGAIYTAQGLVDHCLFVDNYARDCGGAFFTNDYRGRLVNCTFYHNTARVCGGNILIQQAGSLPIVNCIIMAGEPQQIGFWGNGELFVSYSDIQGGRERIGYVNDNDRWYARINWAESNFDADPLFADADNGDFRLTADSPCIDAGDPDSPLDPDRTRADIGAFYFAHQPLISTEPDSLNFGAVIVGASRELNLHIGNIGNEPLVLESVETDNEAFQAGLEEQVTIEPGEGFDLAVVFAPQDFIQVEGNLIIQSNDLVNPDFEVTLFGTGVEELPDLRYFTGFEQTGANHSLLIDGLTFEEEDVPSGWEIGVFTPAGRLCGAGIWSAMMRSAGISVWGDDSLSEEIDGFLPGEYFRFRVWDDRDEVEYPAIGWIEEGPFNWRENAATALSLNAMEERRQTISLRQGWNLISLNVIPPDSLWVREEGPDIVRMTERLRVDNNLHRIVLLKDEIGRFYYPQGRFCNIPYWDLTRGYYVKALSAVEVEWTGEPVEPYADVPLHRGWNIAAYYPFYNLSAAAPGFDVISTIIDNVLIAKNAEGRFIWPLRGFSNMPPWTPGQGYLVKAANDVVLNYPYPAQRFNSLPGEAPLAETAHFRFTSRTGDFLPVLVLGLEVAGRQAEEGDEIGVFDGDTLCIGGGVWTGEMPLGFAAWRDDETTPAIDGYRNSRNITFRFWDRSENEEIRPNGTRTAGADLQNDGSIWAGDLTFDGPVSRPEIPKEFKLGPIFPNPFNSNTIIGYALPVASDVNLSLFDLNGRKVADIYRGFCEPGSYRLPYNAVKIPSGIYVLKMATAEYISTTKLEILR